jgi:hypothetical protein
VNVEGEGKAAGVFKGRSPSIEASRVRELKVQAMRGLRTLPRRLRSDAPPCIGYSTSPFRKSEPEIAATRSSGRGPADVETGAPVEMHVRHAARLETLHTSARARYAEPRRLSRASRPLP